MHKKSKEAWDGYDDQLKEIVASFDAPDILEFGGGRSPGFKLSELPPNVNSYTVNDIEESELELAPEGYEKACFNVCGDVSKFAGKYDVVFSKMLAEHVPDGEAMHRNALELLKPGGVAFHFNPKLYAVPFVVNRLIPENLSRSILFKLDPKRVSEVPKFPAVYSWCRGSTDKLEERIKSLGYSDVKVIPFYGHSYYKKLPVLRQGEKIMSNFYGKNDVSVFAAFMYTIARK